MEKPVGRSTQDINALGAQHIEGAFFFSWRLFEWDAPREDLQPCSRNLLSVAYIMACQFKSGNNKKKIWETTT